MLAYNLKKYFLIVFTIISIAMFYYGHVFINLDHDVIKSVLLITLGMVITCFFIAQCFIRISGDIFTLKDNIDMTMTMIIGMLILTALFVLHAFFIELYYKSP